MSTADLEEMIDKDRTTGDPVTELRLREIELEEKRMKAVRDVTYSDVEHFDGGDVCIACDCRCFDYFTVMDATSVASIETIVAMVFIGIIANYIFWLIICLVTCNIRVTCLYFVFLYCSFLCSTALFMM